MCGALLLLGSACQKPVPKRPNVLLVSIDTLRADHLGCYGYERSTSPSIDALAKRGVRFERAHSQANQTLPSHLSLLTSLFPAEFQITRDDGRNASQQATKLRLPEVALTLAEVAQAAGYRTGAFTGGGLVAPRYGMDQGFATFVAAREPTEQGFATSLPQFKRWLDEGDAAGDDAPFFAFVHSYDVHDPYHAPAPFDLAFSQRRAEDFVAQRGFLPTVNDLRQKLASPSKDELQEIIDFYDNGIAFADRGVGLLETILEERGAWDNTLVVLFSDHGEEFQDHGGWGHGPKLFDELLHVPLILRLPGDAHAGEVVPELVRLVDIAPTVAELLDVPTGSDWKGVSLMELVGRRGADRVVLAEISNAALGTSCLREGDWKVIDVPSSKSVLLFETSDDPGEVVDLSARETERAERMRADLQRYRAELAAASLGLRAVPMGAAAQSLQELEAELLGKMGYLDD